MSGDETDRLITAAIGQVGRADRNASVLRGFAVTVLVIASVSSAIMLLAALWIGFNDDERLGLSALPAVLIAIGVFLQGLFVWAVLAALANLVSNGARALEMQVVQTALVVSEDDDGELKS